MKSSNEAVEKSPYITYKNDLLEIITKEFRDSIEYNKKFTFNINFNNKPIERVLVKTSTAWDSAPHFVSSGSFDTNKSTSYCSDKDNVQRGYFANSSLKKFNKFNINFITNNQQTRSFKTYRSLISDNQRNPTILSRLKEAYNMPANGAKKLDSTAGMKSTIQQESLHKLVNQLGTNLTEEQKKQLKVAFAEGYLAASHPENTAEKGGKAIKFLKIIQQLLMIIVITAIMVSLFSSNNGSVFR